MKFYEKSYRRNLVDMHIEDWNEEFLSKFSADDYYDNLVRAKINLAMIYIQSHVGYCFFPTKAGKMHSAFKGREGEMKKLFEKCRANGIFVTAYFSVIFDNYAYSLSEKFRIRDLNGGCSRDGGGKYGIVCPNSQGYREYLEKVIAEFCGFFDFDGVFFDMTFWPAVCYCDSCKARYRKEKGKQIPEFIDWSDNEWVEFQKTREAWIEEFAFFINKNVRKHKKDVSVTHQYSPALQYFRLAQTEALTKAITYCSGDFYGGLSQHSFAAKLYDSLTQNKPFEFHTSRCYPNLYDHTTTKTRDMLAQSVALTYAHHGAAQLIDAIDPCGTLNKALYDEMGSIFSELMPYEKYFKGCLAADNAVYLNMQGKYDPLSPKTSADKADDVSRMPHVSASVGAACALQKHHIPYAVITNLRPDEINNYKTVSLCDAVNMSDAECEIFKNYVKGGGNLYMSGQSAPKLFKEFFGAEYDGFTEYGMTYMTPEVKGVMPSNTLQAPLCLPRPQMKIKGRYKGEVLASMVLPYTQPKTVSFSAVDFSNGKKEEEIKFSSIHANPPSAKISGVSVLRTKYGKGTVIWAAAALEGAERYTCDEAYVNLLKTMHSDFVFTANAPKCVEFILFDDKDKLYFSAVNLQNDFEVLPIFNVTARVKCGKPPKAVRLLPGSTNVKFEYADGYAQFNIKELKILNMYEIEKEI